MTGSAMGMIVAMSQDGWMQESSPPSRLHGLGPQDYLREFELRAGGFAQLLAEGDLEAPVPPCPGWQLADLGEHLGEIHQWATHAVVAGNPDASPTPAPKDRDGLVDWYRSAANTLLKTLRNTDPNAPAWNFGPKPRTAGFWHRRQAHETTIHHWDAAASQGALPPIDEALARDGIDELLTMFFPRQVRLGRMPALEQTLALELDGSGTADPGQRWVVAGNGLGPSSAPDASAEATVSGPAEALLLLLWRRVELDDPRLTIAGNPAAVHAVLTAGITP
jgi:uncharacterized protein (TIGR03083 family)